MDSLSWKKLNKGVLMLFGPGLNPENYSARAFQFLSLLVGHEVCCFAKHEPRSCRLHIEQSRDNADFAAAVAGFGRYMAKYPLFCFDPKVNEGKPFCRSDFFSQREFQQLDIYAEGFRRVGITNHFAVHVPTRDDSVVFFGLERCGGKDYVEEDRKILSAAQPHLTNAWKLAEVAGDSPLAPVDPSFFSRFGLTPRQSEVLFWLTEGKSNLEIAHILHLGLPSVKGYMSTIFNALGVDNRLAATLAAIDLIRKFRPFSGESQSVVVSTRPRSE